MNLLQLRGNERGVGGVSDQQPWAGARAGDAAQARGEEEERAVVGEWEAAEWVWLAQGKFWMKSLV